MDAIDEQATEDIVGHFVVHCNECVISGAHRFGHAGKRTERIFSEASSLPVLAMHG
jgi:hypothetical protein